MRTAGIPGLNARISSALCIVLVILRTSPVGVGRDGLSVSVVAR